ncbi:MAG TPA: M1 family metallopeptidase [Kofleriaceae bacterium]|nr:M1 family metallopeptidase [Kofleriaceae bacterium]
MRGPPALLLALLLAACRGTPEVEVVPMPAPDKTPPWIATDKPPPAIASYTIQATLDVGTHQLRGRETLTWVNSGHDPVDVLPFHLYMNAFKNEDSVFMRESRGKHRGERAARAGWGWIEVNAIAVDGGPDASGRLRYPALPDETVMELPLDKPVPPGGTVSVTIMFEVQLPVVFARTGYKGDFHMIGQWFPKIGVRVGEPGKERWHCEPFHVMSEFFADFGNYDVTLTVPDTHVVAATGVLAEARDNQDETRVLRYKAEGVHDFVWMADPFMEIVKASAHTPHGPVDVWVYSRPAQREFAERHLAAGVATIEALSVMIHPYPWARMTIVDPPPDAAGGAGGMEYPTLVTTAADSVFAPEGVWLPEFVTVHEVGHNWFQGILASNEVDEAWLDEGMNEYIDGVVMEKLYGRETSGLDWGGFRAGIESIRLVMGGAFRDLPDPIAQRSYLFCDFSSYGVATYSKTAAAMSTLEHAVGSKKFLAALRAYGAEMAFKHPTEADLLRILERELGQDVDWFLQPALHRLGAADLRVRGISCRLKRASRGVFGRGGHRKVVDADPAPDAPYSCEVVVENLGNVPVPVDVEMVLDDGRRVVKRWDDRGDGPRWHRFELEDRQPVVEVTIDPANRVALDDGGLRRSLRVRPESEAIDRSAAHAQFWTQTAMQVLGL